MLDGMDSEPGASDNRLSLTPSEFGVEDWEDGKEYVFSKVRVRQVSSGEFEVLEATPEGAPKEETQEANPGDSESTAEDMGGMGEVESAYPNPAVARMMKR
jgi:hypothetical protein